MRMRLGGGGDVERSWRKGGGVGVVGKLVAVWGFWDRGVGCVVKGERRGGEGEEAGDSGEEGNGKGG